MIRTGQWFIIIRIFSINLKNLKNNKTLEKPIKCRKKYKNFTQVEHVKISPKKLNFGDLLSPLSRRVATPQISLMRYLRFFARPFRHFIFLCRCDQLDVARVAIETFFKLYCKT